MWYQLMWRDGCEILFFSCLFYYTARWLKKDRHTNLLGYAIIYGLLATLSYVFELHSITTFLLWFSPTIALIFILLHQETLQKNFICAPTASHKLTQQDNWLDIVLSICLFNMYQTKATSCIIEHTHNLTELLESPFLLNAPVQQELLTMLCNSQSYDEHKSIWITSQGIVRGINTRWKHNHSVSYSSCAAHISPIISIDQALVLTTKTDALIFFLDPTTRLFTVIIHDTLFKKISATHAHQLIKKYVTSKEIAQETFNENSTHNRPQRHTS